MQRIDGGLSYKYILTDQSLLSSDDTVHKYKDFRALVAHHRSFEQRMMNRGLRDSDKDTCSQKDSWTAGLHGGRRRLAVGCKDPAEGFK